MGMEGRLRMTKSVGLGTVIMVAGGKRPEGKLTVTAHAGHVIFAGPLFTLEMTPAQARQWQRAFSRWIREAEKQGEGDAPRDD